MSDKAFNYTVFLNQLLTLLAVMFGLVFIYVDPLKGLRNILHTVVYAITHAIKVLTDCFDPRLQKSCQVECEADLWQPVKPGPTTSLTDPLKEENALELYGDLTQLTDLRNSVITLQNRMTTLESHKISATTEVLLKMVQDLVTEVRGQTQPCTGQLCCETTQSQQLKVVTQLNSQVNKLNLEINQLQDRIAAQETSLSMKEQYIATLQAKISTFPGSLDPVSSVSYHDPVTDYLTPLAEQSQVNPGQPRGALTMTQSTGHARSPQTLDDKLLWTMSKHIDHFHPRVSGNADTNAYLDSISDTLRFHEPVTVETRIRLLRLTSSREVASCLKRQPTQTLECWHSVRQAIFEEFGDHHTHSGLISAIAVKQRDGEQVRIFYKRLMKAFFGTNNTPGMEEDVHFKALFLNNLLPSIKKHFPLGVKSEKICAAKLRNLAQEAFSRESATTANDEIDTCFPRKKDDYSHLPSRVNRESPALVFPTESRRQRKVRIHLTKQRSSPADDNWRKSMRNYAP